MITPEQFLKDFLRRTVESPGEKMAYVSGHARLMELRELARQHKEIERLLTLAKKNGAVFKADLEQRLKDIEAEAEKEHDYEPIRI